MSAEPLSVKYYPTPESLDLEIVKRITPVDRVLDVGCGIRPQSFFKPYLHICVEPCQEYATILKARFARDAGFLVLEGTGEAILPTLPDASMDSVFLIDVIEHLSKAEGQEILKHIMRIARRQVLVFTPLGFMPQHYEAGEKDAWGLGGASYQEHKSGWLPEDFGPDWAFYICEKYHNLPVTPSAAAQSYGAFWAVLNRPSSQKILGLKTLFLGSDLSLVKAELLAVDPQCYGLMNLSSFRGILCRGEFLCTANFLLHIFWKMLRHRYRRLVYVGTNSGVLTFFQKFGRYLDNRLIVLSPDQAAVWIREAVILLRHA